MGAATIFAKAASKAAPEVEKTLEAGKETGVLGKIGHGIGNAFAAKPVHTVAALGATLPVATGSVAMTKGIWDLSHPKTPQANTTTAGGKGQGQQQGQQANASGGGNGILGSLGSMVGGLMNNGLVKNGLLIGGALMLGKMLGGGGILKTILTVGAAVAGISMLTGNGGNGQGGNIFSNALSGLANTLTGKGSQQQQASANAQLSATGNEVMPTDGARENYNQGTQQQLGQAFQQNAPQAQAQQQASQQKSLQADGPETSV